MIQFEKIADLMCWEIYEGETAEDAFVRNGNNLNALPSNLVINIVHEGGLQKWAETLTVSSQVELYKKILQAIRRTISDPVFSDPKKINIFPPFGNFFYFCQKLDRNGKSAIEAEAIADVSWNGVICRRMLSQNVSKFFKEEPCADKYSQSVEKIKNIWGFTDKEVDAIRYYVCQTRHNGHNPSLNKNIYLWGKAKQTGKTTIARAIVTILNGDTFNNFGKYESTFSQEMQYNDHDLPLSALYNAILLDESMPRDTKKSYGRIKAVLTSSSCNYNPKFRQPINIKCNRFYFCTSNEDIADFVQDATERRFFAINVEKKPHHMSFEDIYSIWFDFCTNATPEESWQEWYDSFDFVDGLATKNIEEVHNEIILRGEELFTALQGTYVTVKKIASQIFKNEPTGDQKKSVADAMADSFGDFRLKSNPSYYSVHKCRERAAELRNKIETSDGDTPSIPNMPF